MKGFSRKETVEYYRSIIERAWKQVEAAETPEVKSEKYEEVMEWTMLDKDYDDRTRRAFGSGPVFVPMWWPRYDPSFPRPGTSAPVSLPSQTGGMPSGGSRQVSLPHLPGSDFAASVVTGVQNFSGRRGRQRERLHQASHQPHQPGTQDINDQLMAGQRFR